MQRLEARVAHSGQLLAALSYRGVLARGFALVRDEQRPSPCMPPPRSGPSAHLVDRVRRRPRRRHRGCRSAGGDVGRQQARPKPERAKPDDRGQARGKAGRSGQLVLELLHAFFFTRRCPLAGKLWLPRQPFRDALLRIGARFRIGADVAAFGQRGIAVPPIAYAAEDWRGRNRAARRDRPRSAPARCGRARRPPSGGRPAAN